MRDILRPILFLISLSITICIALIPSYVGISLPGFEIEAGDEWDPGSGAQIGLYLFMNAYYIFFVLFCMTPFLTLILWTISSKFKRSTSKGGSGRSSGPDPIIFSGGVCPRVTVIIPCFNEATHVGIAVMSALRQTYESEIEVIVVDDGSNDQTYSIGRILTLVLPHRNA
jgi:hypothetical protein